MTPKTEGRATLLLVDWSYDYDERRFTDIVCELDRYPGWLIRPTVTVTERGLLLERLSIEPSGPGTPPDGITARMMRQLRVGELLAALRAATQQADRYVGSSPELTVNTRVGRRGRNDSYYAGWAAAYVEALARSSRPVEDLAVRNSLSSSQVRNLIHACRRRGMLTASPPGRAGGQLTAAARRILAGDD